MNKIYLSLALLVMPMLHTKDTRLQLERITIDSPVLNLVDGTALINVEQMMHFGKNLLILMNGGTKEQIEYLTKRYNLNHPYTFDWSESKTHGIIPFNGRYYTLRELAEEESHNENDQLQEALQETLKIFEAFSEPYVEQVNTGKHYLVRLIERWSNMRSKKDTALLEWARVESGSEQSELRKNIVSFRALDKFCTDLTIFLADMIQSCPKSFKIYKERHKK